MVREAPASNQPQRSPPKRKLRNYLLDARFQLKYTGAVVVVTALVAGFLGFWAYRYSAEQTHSLTIQASMEQGLTPDAMEAILHQAELEDRKVLATIVGGISALVLALAVTGIMVTHRVVGPAYKLRRLITHVADGHLEVAGRLRKGDELQDVFLAFERMVHELRRKQQVEVDKLDVILRAFEDAASPELEDELEQLRGLRDAMAAELERKSLV